MPELYLGQRQRRGNLLLWILLLLGLLLCSRYIAETFISYAWWSELHQLDTWVNQLIYGTGPFVLAALLLFVAFHLGFPGRIAPPVRFETALRLPESKACRTASALLVFALLALLVANATVDSWTVVRYFGGLRLPSSAAEYIDPIFKRPLHFYFFALPFYNLLLQVILSGRCPRSAHLLVDA